jgi:uncharacterized protein YndB with AHSA1/START domain
MLAQFRNEIEIEAAPEVVFDELSDQRHEMRWSPKMRSVELLTGEPITAGSRLRARWAGTPGNDVVYTEYERPKRWAMRFTSWLMVAETAGDLVPTATGTQLTSTWNMHLRGPLRPLSGMVARNIGKGVAESIRLAKAHVEQQSGEAGHDRLPMSP